LSSSSAYLRHISRSIRCSSLSTPAMALMARRGRRAAPVVARRLRENMGEGDGDDVRDESSCARQTQTKPLSRHRVTKSKIPCRVHASPPRKEHTRPSPQKRAAHAVSGAENWAACRGGHRAGCVARRGLG
jgi:hypothetical protein